ncbi:hypothetical protein BRD00_01755 [Halobacteriales archaeon QS_8_69_26]|nr:MAG: hypothetical protein BRD00_01755 [Halobacteriales archaeon QS_8_69_26]
MTSESDNPRDRTYSRRSVLRTAEFAAAGGVIGTLATGTAAARADCALPEDYEYYSENDYEARDATTSYDESRYRKNYYEFVTRAIELRSGVTIADSWYDTYRGKYKSDHLVAGHVQTQEDDGDWDHYANIQKQTATVENLRPDTSAMLTSEDDDWIGGAPDPGSELNYGDAAFTVLKAAIGSVNPKLGMAITAYDATNALLQDGENTNEFDEKEEYVWDYGTFDQPCEATHFVKVRLVADQGETTMEAKLSNSAVNDIPDMSVSQAWNVYVYEDWYEDIDQTSTSSTDTTSTSETSGSGRPEPGTPEYEEYLERSDRFVKVPYEDLRDKSKTEPGHAIYRSVDPKVGIRRVDHAE